MFGDMNNPTEEAPVDSHEIDTIRGKATIPLWPDAGRLLGISRNVAYDAARRGAIPTLKLGKNIRVPVPKLLAMLGVVDREPATPAA